MENFMDPDTYILRPLAQRWMELASLPVMEDRKRLWTALKDRRPERPMLLFETWTVQGYVGENELLCTDPFLREIELVMRRMIRQVEEIGDDVVIEPCWPVDWVIENDGYGVPILAEHADDTHGGQVAYHYNHPVQTPEDISQLRPRTFELNREKTFQRKAMLEDTFGDLLPVKLRGTGGHCAALTSDLFRLIGNDNLLAWLYDAPDALHQIMAYLRDDRLAYYRWLEQEKLLALNNNDVWVGSGSPGFTTELPAPGYAGQPRLRDLWIWMESQETTMISPRMFARFFLPYMAEVAGCFGLVYYGCCEPVHDRWEPILKAIPNIRAVSVSPWCDMRAVGEKLGREIIFSRKPKPWLISGDAPDWSGLEADLDATLDAARGGCLEIIFRDVYSVKERSTLTRWADLVRSRVGGKRI
jgi:hypothetical protein